MTAHFVTAPFQEVILAYALMFFAIGMELTGTTLLKYSQGFTKLLPTIGCLVSYFICFFSFSRALNDLNLAWRMRPGAASASWRLSSFPGSSSARS